MGPPGEVPGAASIVPGGMERASGRLSSSSPGGISWIAQTTERSTRSERGGPPAARRQPAAVLGRRRRRTTPRPGTDAGPRATYVFACAKRRLRGAMDGAGEPEEPGSTRPPSGVLGASHADGPRVFSVNGRDLYTCTRVHKSAEAVHRPRTDRGSARAWPRSCSCGASDNRSYVEWSRSTLYSESSDGTSAGRIGYSHLRPDAT